MYLHESLNDKKFKNDKKLLLLKNNTINLHQFIALLDRDNDPYVLIGPAVVDKEFVDQFIEKQKNYAQEFEQLNKNDSLTSIQLVELLLEIIPLTKIVIPEISQSLDLMFKQLANSKCQTCVIIRYIGMYIGMTSAYINDGRNINSIKDNYFKLKSIIDQSLPQSNTEILIEQLDNKWIDPINLLCLGNDLIEDLESCVECSIKHLGRAKILCEEFLQGYPNYKTLLAKEMKKSTESMEVFYIKYWDILSQLDMASCELVGNIADLDKRVAVLLIDLANIIRKERIDFLIDGNIPHFSKLMMEIKKLQFKIKNI